MHRLTLFGGAWIEGPNGRLAGRAAQPRQLLVLALLATGPPSGRRREQLAALLWADHDSAAARHLLSDALYVLRRELGAGAIVASPGGVRLDPGCVSSDVAEFRSAWRGGDLETAAQLYHGAFLEGVELTGPPEVEQWVAAERAALRREALDAALGLARGASPHLDSSLAIHWAMEARRIDPYSEEAVRQLVSLLDRHGDRADAVRAYADYRETLARELELEPSPETQALIEAVRTREKTRPEHGTSRPVAISRGSPRQDPAPRQPAQPAPRRSATAAMLLVTVLLAGGVLMTAVTAGRSSQDAIGPAGPKSVAVLPFAVKGPGPTDAALGQELSDELVELLAAQAGARIVLRRGGAPGLSREGDRHTLIRALRAECLVTGSVRTESGQLRVDAELIDSAVRAPLWSATFTAPAPDPTGSRQIAREIAAALYERLEYVQELVQPTR